MILILLSDDFFTLKKPKGTFSQFMNHTRQWSTKKDRKDKELEKEIEDSSQEEPEVESEIDQNEISYSPMS